VVLDFDPAKLPALPKVGCVIILRGHATKRHGLSTPPRPHRTLCPSAPWDISLPRGRSFPLDDAHVDYFLDYTRAISPETSPGIPLRLLTLTGTPAWMTCENRFSRQRRVDYERYCAR